MGLLHAGDWVGEWIRSAEAEDHQHVWFRKSFDLDHAPGGVRAYVCSIGYHELYVNGVRIGDAVLTPGVTNLAKRGLYMTYDITAALQPGRNVVAIWTGPRWARADGSYGKGVWKQTPMLRCQLHADEAATIRSDTTWRTWISSSENIGLWKGGGQGTYGGERIDARRHIHNWNAVDLDDSHWPHVVRGEQSIELSAAVFEPDRKVETLRPISIEQREGAWRIDMGRNYTGWFEIDLRGGREGDVVKIHTSNRLEATLEYDQESEYIFDATGTGTFCHRFNWMAGRWITIHGLRERPVASDIRGYVVTNDRPRHGRFECSNGLLNAIYETDLRTYIANTVNAAVMDCPHRERYGYGEVALACTWGCGIPNYDSAAMYTKAARDWFDVQSDDGMINTIAPQPYSGAGGTLWSSAPLTLCWEFYRAYGDRRLIERAYPVLERWLAYLQKAVRADGVLMPYARTSRFLGDWATPHGSEYGDTPAAQLFNNCVYAYDLMVMVEIARELGRVDEVLVYEARLNDLRRAVHQHFFDPTTRRYGDGRQMSMLFPLYTRITPEPLREGVLDAFKRDLVEKGYMDTGSPGLPIMLKCVLEDLGAPELLLPCLMRTAYPGYGFFLARQESTWPEYWEIDGIESRIHTCYTSIAGYFIKGIGGIQPSPDAHGMQRFVIRPYCPESLTYARTTTASLYGPINCNWKRAGDEMSLEVIVPPNTRATVFVPAPESTDVTESDVALDGAGGVTRVNVAGQIALDVVSGRYVFAWKSPAPAAVR
jgi:alpha-L-rhamnosidase